jgi:C4-dicarboxylate-specific signal transduction histidine kinase
MALVPTACWDRQGRLVDANDAYLQLIGCTRMEIGTRPIFYRDLLAGAGHGRQPRTPRSAGVSGAWRQESYVVRDGRIVHVLTASAPKQGDPGRCVTFAVDITECVAARDRAQHIQRLSIDVERVNRALTIEHLAAWLVHELSQPLMATVAAAQASRRMLNGPRPQLAEIRKSFDDIAAYQLRVSKIVQKLRELLPEAVPERTAIDVNAVIGEAVTLLRENGELDGCSVYLALDRDSPPVTAVRSQLRQVLVSIMLNAIEAMPPTRKRRRLSIETTGSRATVRIRIRDTGVGIRRVDRPRVFEALMTTRRGSAGLGLHVAKSIIREHGGTIRVAARSRGGAEFQLTLPVSSGNCTP